jgi:hypothetical protein
MMSFLITNGYTMVLFIDGVVKTTFGFVGIWAWSLGGFGRRVGGKGDGECWRVF